MIRKKRILIKKWILNIINLNSRRFKVKLSDCIEEFGHSYGTNGTHFFIKALQHSENESEIYSYLNEYYKKFTIKSFNEIVGRDIGNEAGNMYFCPWEKGRLRPLSKFEPSHKVGPTSEESLWKIVNRLNTLFRKVKKEGFRQFSILEGIPCVLQLVNKSNKIKYIVRDGQHRLAIASYLGQEYIWVCYNSVYYGRCASESIIHEKDVDNWPYVKEGIVLPEDAIIFFNSVFNNSRNEEKDKR